MATAKKSLSTFDLVARDLADAQAHVSEALTLVEDRVPADIIDKLVAVSGYLWTRIDAQLERVAS